MNNSEMILYKYLNEELSKYYEFETNRLCEILKINHNSKNKNSLIIKKIIEKSSKKELIQNLIYELNCKFKTVNTEWNKNLKESMSLPIIDYCKLCSEEWETSSLRNYLSSTLFCFVVFKKEFEESKIHDVKLWKVPKRLLDGDIKKTWILTRNIIKDGCIVDYIDNRGRIVTRFPKISETKYVHVRPHASNKNDVRPLPLPDLVTGQKYFTKHSFWLNRNFIDKIIRTNKYND